MKGVYKKILIGLAVLVIAGFLHWLTTKDDSLIRSPEVHQTAEAQKTIRHTAADKPVEWIVHAGDGYEFQYPDNWQVINESDRAGFLEVKTINKPTSHRPIVSQIAFYIKQADREKPFNLYNYIAEGINTSADLKNHLISNCAEMNQERDCRYDLIEELAINGKEAVRADINYLGALNRHFYILDGDLFYVFVSGRGPEVPADELIIEDVAKSLTIL